MVNGTILPFPAAGGVKTPPRPPSPTAANREDFSGAMDDALEARSTRRADSGSRAASRRPEPQRPREASEKVAAAQARRPSSVKPARKADDVEAADDETAVEREAEASASGAVASADQSDPTPAEARTGGDAAAGDPAAQAGTTDDLAGTAVICNAALPDEGEGDADAEDGDDPLARGRRWDTPAAGQADEDGETAPNGAPQRAGRGAGSGLKLGHAIQQARADANAAPGEALAQIAQEVVAAAHAEAAAAEVATNEPAAPAGETAAAKAQTASAAAAAATAVENAAAALETVAAVEASADASTSEGSDTQEQGQPKPPAPGAQANAATVVAGGPEGGVKFTVNSAAGSAAYTNAAPRSEEAVLPQIVQSIRLHAVQGTTEARVQLRPEHLGVLNITLRVEQNQVTATIQADVAAVRQWIESHEASLRQSLSEQGLHLAKLVVHEDEQQAAKDEQDGERPRREPRRRSWRDEAATFEVLV